MKPKAGRYYLVILKGNETQDRVILSVMLSKWGAPNMFKPIWCNGDDLKKSCCLSLNLFSETSARFRRHIELQGVMRRAEDTTSCNQNMFFCFFFFGQNAQTLCWNRTRTKTHARKHVVPWWKRDRAGLSSCGTKNLCGSLDTQGELDQMGWGELKGQVSYKFVLKRTVSPSSVPNGPKIQKSQTFKNFFTLGGPGCLILSMLPNLVTFWIVTAWWVFLQCRWGLGPSRRIPPECH